MTAAWFVIGGAWSVLVFVAGIVAAVTAARVRARRLAAPARRYR